LFNISASLEEQEVLRLPQTDAGHLQRCTGDPQEDGTRQEATGVGELKTL